MDSIFAPWRMEYIKSEKPKGCVFCKSSIRCDDYVIYEGKTCFVMMNRYPYACGHLMIIPFRHVAEIKDLTKEEKNEMFDLMDAAIRVLKEAMNPGGFNTGLNIGKASGAGIEEHIHMHVIPRWEGDTNFMSAVSDIRVIPEDLRSTAKKLAPLFQKYHRED
jgi:ATP adenylyltransferase